MEKRLKAKDEDELIPESASPIVARSPSPMFAPPAKPTPPGVILSWRGEDFLLPNSL